MKTIFSTIVFFISLNLFAQEKPNFKAIDSLYREDQFYVGVFYNSLQNLPQGISQGRFSPSFSFGFLRDMPINKQRTFAFAAGLGYSINNYNQNILSKSVNNVIQYSVFDKSFETNKLVLHYIDLPLEIRWRTSTPEIHQFWRIYAGFKASYLVYDRTKFVDNNNTFIETANQDFNKIQYGTYLCIGNNTINAYAYFGLNDIYKSAFIGNEKIELRTLNFGFMFYIL